MHIRILIGGALAAAIAGAWTAFTLAGSLAPLLPPTLRGYALQVCSLGFIAGGIVVGSTLRGRWFVPWAFGASAVVPGIAVPLLLVATQGIHRPIDLMAAQFLLPALAYATMGVLDGLVAGLGARRALLTGAAFAGGVVIGPLAASILVRHLSPWWGIGLTIGAPWLTGALALAWFVRRPVSPIGFPVTTKV